MIYHNYLEKLLGNKTKISLLRTLYKIPDKVWTSRGLARFIGIYNTTILDNVRDLAEMGILQVGNYGRGKTIQLNKQSFVFAEIIKPLFEKEENSLAILTKKLKSLFGRADLELLVLFGSLVSHEEKPNSDIDILIVTKDKKQVENIITQQQGEIAKQFSNELSPYIFSPSEFKARRNAPFVKDIKKKHILLRGGWK